MSCARSTDTCVKFLHACSVVGVVNANYTRLRPSLVLRFHKINRATMICKRENWCSKWKIQASEELLQAGEEPRMKEEERKKEQNLKQPYSIPLGIFLMLCLKSVENLKQSRDTILYPLGISLSTRLL